MLIHRRLPPSRRFPSRNPLRLALLALAAATPPVCSQTSSAVLPEAVFARQHERYLMYCANCHGADWQGGLGGSLVDGKWRRGGNPDQIFHSIAVGYPETGMPGYAALWPDNEIAEMVAYLFEAGRRHAALQEQKAVAPPDRELAAAGVRFRVETVAEGLETPWSIAWLPDGRMLVTERPGPLRLVERDGTLSAPVAGTPAVWARNQGGMMEVAVHPEYAANGWIYLSFSDPRTVGGRTVAFTAIVRGRIRDGRWVDEETIFEAPESFYTASEKHWGCKLAFDGRGYLFFGIGDRGRDELAQDLAHPAGKIHRVHDDGRAPADNPFAGQPGVFPTVWAYGVRNPQGLAFDTVSGRLWETEHGPRGGDEFNLIVPGRNYGWPRVSRGRNYNFMPVKWARSHPDMEEPLLDWTPSIGASGLAFYDAAPFPAWRGSFLAGGLVGETLDRLVIGADGSVQRETVLHGLGRVRDVRVGPDGFVYLALNHRSRAQAGRIVRLVPR
jgi:glucose/arabinose dehydrogenase